MARRLYRSNTTKVIGGVCGGFGEYFEVDPVLIRIIAVILAMANGVGLIAYLVAWVIIPKRPLGMEVEGDPPDSAWYRYLPGIILIAIGVIILARQYWYWFDLGDMWPILIILVGLGLIFIKGTRDNGDSMIAGDNHTRNGQDNGSVR
jgi:phage shock protein C